MHRVCFIVLQLFITYSVYSQYINRSYIQIYGEGLIGQHFDNNSQMIRYELEDAVSMARNEIFEFASGMLYGYRFNLVTSNPVNGRRGYFDLEKIAVIRNNDPNMRVSQYEHSETSIRVQGTYRLQDSQKNYISGFRGAGGHMTQGTAEGSYYNDWTGRIEIYKNAIYDGIINAARLELKSRPLSITGKVLIESPPQYNLISGKWVTNVRFHLIISNITYENVY